MYNAGGNVGGGSTPFNSDGANNATCQTTWVWEVTIEVTRQVEGGYRVRRKYQERFERTYDIFGELLKSFTATILVRVIIRKPVEENLYISSDIRKLITFEFPIQSDVRKDMVIELVVDADLRKEIVESVELQGMLRREIELSLPTSATINLSEKERNILNQMTLMMIMGELEKDEQ